MKTAQRILSAAVLAISLPHCAGKDTGNLERGKLIAGILGIFTKEVVADAVPMGMLVTRTFQMFSLQENLEAIAFADKEGIVRAHNDPGRLLQKPEAVPAAGRADKEAVTVRDILWEGKARQQIAAPVFLIANNQDTLLGTISLTLRPGRGQIRDKDFAQYPLHVQKAVITAKLLAVFAELNAMESLRCNGAVVDIYNRFAESMRIREIVLTAQDNRIFAHHDEGRLFMQFECPPLVDCTHDKKPHVQVYSQGSKVFITEPIWSRRAAELVCEGYVYVDADLATE